MEILYYMFAFCKFASGSTAMVLHTSPVRFVPHVHASILCVYMGELIISYNMHMYEEHIDGKPASCTWECSWNHDFTRYSQVCTSTLNGLWRNACSGVRTLILSQYILLSMYRCWRKALCAISVLITLPRSS